MPNPLGLTPPEGDKMLGRERECEQKMYIHVYAWA